MSTHVRNEHYFIKSSSRVLGPLRLDQIRSLHTRGRLENYQLISSDRRSWQPIPEFISGLRGGLSSSSKSPQEPNETADFGGVDEVNLEVAASAPSTGIDSPVPKLKISGSATAMLQVVVPVALLLIVVTVAPFISDSTDEQWTERIAALANHSVVRINVADGHGTGFVVASKDDNHLILTNRHVISGNQIVTVELHSGMKAPGNVVGLPVDSEIDLALVEVRQVSDLQPLGRLARFQGIRAGAEVVAVGHPLALDYTITDGIVSAKRNDFLQTSAAIHGGNSGGPLINKSGEIVGVNTLGIKPEFGHNIGFAFRADYLLDRRLWKFSADVNQLLERVK